MKELLPGISSAHGTTDDLYMSGLQNRHGVAPGGEASEGLARFSLAHVGGVPPARRMIARWATGAYFSSRILKAEASGGLLSTPHFIDGCRLTTVAEASAPNDRRDCQDQGTKPDGQQLRRPYWRAGPVSDCSSKITLPACNAAPCVQNRSAGSSWHVPRNRRPRSV